MKKHVPKDWNALTEHDTLLLCIEWWAWLKANPGKMKDGWPRLECNDGDVPYMACDCPCCEYAVQNDIDCEFNNTCLVSNWGKAGDDSVPCCVSDSPFTLWLKASFPEDYCSRDAMGEMHSDEPNLVEAAKQAGRIVKLAKDALKQIDKG